MSTHIQWTDETWNPVVGCTKVSAGCKNCYAKTLHDNRHKAYLAGKLQNLPQYAQPFEVVQLMPERLTAPLSWKKPRKVFVNSVSDLFHENVPFDFIDQIFQVMFWAKRHTFQILTKRPERMAQYFAERADPSKDHWGEAADAVADMVGMEDHPHVLETKHMPLPNVWLGTSVENQATANERIPHLLKCDAAVRFLSCEPLLGHVDLLDAMGDPSPPTAPSNSPQHEPLLSFLLSRLAPRH